jgi:phosphoglycolate phosphatase-like HAD superfamily hydrolase
MLHVVWDWNGTLFDDLEIVVAAVNVSLAAVGAPPIDADGYRVHYQRPLNRFYEELLGRPVLADEMASIDQDFHDAYHALLDQARLTVDARRAVELVAARRATQSVLSMWWHDRLVPAVRYFGLDDSRGAGAAPPGPAVGAAKEQHLAHHVAQLTRLFPGAVQRQAVVAIGDVTDDAHAARAAGVGCVLYDGGSQPRPALEAAGFPVAATLVEAVELAGLV